MRVMIVGEDAVSRDAFSATAEDSSFSLVRVGTGAEALASIETSVPELVVIDLALPDRSGLEVIEALEEYGVGLSRILILVPGGGACSGRSFDPDVHVMEKPLSLAALRAFLSQRLETLSGSAPLTLLSLVDGVQLAMCVGQSLILELIQQDYAVGQLLIWRGELSGARDFYGEGMAALRRLLNDTAETIRYETLDDASEMSLARSESWGHFAVDPSLDLEAALDDELLGAGAEVERRGTLLGVAPVRKQGRPLGEEEEVDEELLADGVDEAWGGVALASPVPPKGVGERHEVARGHGEPSRGAVPSSGLAVTPSEWEGVPFEELMDRGIDALLNRHFDRAAKAFITARKLRPDDGRVQANLERLRALGHLNDEELE